MTKKITPVKKDSHPFQIGNRYRNRDGEYHVVSITEPNMVIRYLDGRTVNSSIALQARVWENIQEGDDNELEFEPA